jgi:CRISPR/Cas system-associated exonuclease Cas4 (RecB family)
MAKLADFVMKNLKVVDDIVKHYKETGDAEQDREYLGASEIGHECERYLWYSFRHCSAESISGRVYRLFETGDLEEVRLVRNLRDIGCEVHEVDENGEQFALSDHAGHFSGHMDGCALGIPDAPKTWHVLEFKTHNSKSFAHVSVNGVKTSKPVHYAQMQAYMHYTGMTRALYLAVNKETDEIHGERVRYDKEYAEALVEKARRIIVTNEAPPRPFSRKDYYVCRYCDARDICWGTPENALPIGKPHCRQCCHSDPCFDGYARWWCNKHKRTLVYADQLRGCEDHLVLPSLISFAEPTDYMSSDATFSDGGEAIEFTNEDGSKWYHGSMKGCFSTAELMALPPDTLTNRTINDVKRILGAVATGCCYDILERYPEEDSKLAWDGHKDGLIAAWADAYDEDLESLKPTEETRLPTHIANEYYGGRVAIVYNTNWAEIREGKE